MDFSRVLEIDSEINRITWEYTGDPVHSFYSYKISGPDRPPNGNTLVCECAAEPIFEVISTKEIVWEYEISVFMSRQNTTAANPTRIGNAVSRVHRYGPDHPGLKGRELDPDRYANLNRLYA